ncbi:MAG: glycosyltransferase family 4 protein [Candidatus Yanofskybacteria bacterium]|nr:glycosyltransferase family 4 protein [Candidatus Yanofskybacteria bacterium]
MKNLLIICQKVDEGDDLLGFFASWIREFAAHTTRVTVIALGVGAADMPANVQVHSLGKERGVPRWKRWWDFVRLLRREVPRHDAVFCHMSPVFALAAWPFTAVWRKRLVLWYLHRSTTWRLRLAARLVDRIVTADARSLTLQSRAILSVGHGIDVRRFAYPERTPPSGRPLRILSVGRLSPIKGFETLIRAAARLANDDIDCEVRIVGKAVMAGDYAYARELSARVARLGLQERVHLFGFVPYRDMPTQYRWADIVVGCTPPGGIDKVLLEAMAAGCVPLTSNTVMAHQLGEDAGATVFAWRDADELAAKVAGIADIGGMSERMVARAGMQTVETVVRAILSVL